MCVWVWVRTCIDDVRMCVACCSRGDKGGRAGVVRMLDVPGHERLKRKREQHLADACAVVFVLDATDITPHKVCVYVCVVVKGIREPWQSLKPCGAFRVLRSRLVQAILKLRRFILSSQCTQGPCGWYPVCFGCTMLVGSFTQPDECKESGCEVCISDLLYPA
jgi:hypothetical protein